PMPIRPFLNGEQVDQETLRVLGVAFEQVCIALRTGDCADDIKQAIANKIIAIAKAGERNPDMLCEQVLKDIRTEPISSGAARGRPREKECRNGYCIAQSISAT